MEVVNRYKAIVRNMRTLTTPDRNTIPILDYKSAWYWYKKEHQTRYELHIRKLALPIEPPLAPAQFSNLAAPYRAKNPIAQNVLFRYTSKKHAEELAGGVLKIFCASRQRIDPTDSARYDNELSKTKIIPKSYARVAIQGGSPIKLLSDIRECCDVRDYYLLCLSLDWDNMLFDDFKKDTCVVIKDVDKMRERVQNATSRKLPGWNCTDLPITYYDPYCSVGPQEFFDACFCKSIEYAYQQEYRYVWAHPTNTAENYVELSLGSISDLVEVFPRSQ